MPARRPAPGHRVPAPDPRERELRELRARLDEAEDTLRAIREGDVDGVVVHGPGGDRMFTLRGADEAYRSLVEGMAEGAATLSADGTVLYANRFLADLLGVPLPQLLGSHWEQWVAPGGPAFVGLGAPARFEVELRPPGEDPVPALCSVHALAADPEGAFAVVLTDLRETRRRAQAERRLSAVVQAAPIVLWALDRAGTITMLHGARTGPGLTLAGMLGRSVFEVFTGNTEVLEQVRRVLTGESFQQTLHLDGRWWETHFVPERGPDGEVVGAIGVSLDVSEERDAEAALRDRDERLREIMEHATNLFYAHGPDHVLTYLSPQVRDLLGVGPEEARQRWTEFLTDHPVNRAGVEATERALRTGERQPPYELQLRHADGHEVWVLVNESPIVREGKVAGMAGALVDITPRKAAEERMRRSEALLAEAERLAQLGSWDMDLRTGRITWSAEMYRIFEVDPATFTPSREAVRPFIHPEDNRGAHEAFERAIATAGSVTHTYRLVLPDGRVKWVQHRTQGVPGPDGRPSRAFGTFQDVTERHLAEEASARLAAIVEQSVDAVISVDLDGTVRAWNRGAETMFGWTAAEMVGRGPAAMVPPALAAEGVAYRARAAAGEAVSYTTVRRRKDGTDVEVNVTLTPIRAPDGRITSLSAMVHDVTLERRAAAAEREARERAAEVARLEEMNRFRSQFLSTAAHEMNTPITPLSLELHLLASGKQGPLNPKQAHTVRILERNLKRLSLLVQDMLDSARLQTGRLKLSVGPTDLDALAVEARDIYQQPAEAAGVALRLERCGPLPIRADERRLMQVVTNLVGNALKFTPRGGSVTVTTACTAEEARVEVTDTGLGLTEDQLGKLFQPFVQVQEPLPGQPKGTGLGLYICKGIVEQHGGRIWSASEGPGKGSTFGFALPLTAAGPEAPGGRPR